MMALSEFMRETLIQLSRKNPAHGTLQLFCEIVILECAVNLPRKNVHLVTPLYAGLYSPAAMVANNVLKLRT